MWPFRKKKTDTKSIAPLAESETPLDEWSILPAPPVVLEPLQLTIDTEDFEPGLSTRRDHELFLAPLEHGVSEEAPSGRFEGLVTVVSPEEKHRAALASLSRETPSKEEEVPDTPRSANPPPRPIDSEAPPSIAEAETPVISIAPSNPKMTRVPELDDLLPQLDLRPPKPEVPPVPEVTTPERQEIADRPEKVDPVIPPTDSRPTVGRPQADQPRRIGLGEPISHKPVTKSSTPSEMRGPTTQPGASKPETPQPETELILRPEQPEPGVEAGRDSDPPQVDSSPDEVGVLRPRVTTPIDARTDSPTSPITKSLAQRPLETRFTPPVRKSEIRPTLARTPSPLQRQIAVGSPSAATHPTSLHPVPSPHLTPRIGSSEEVTNTPRKDKVELAGPTKFRSEPAPSVSITGGSHRFAPKEPEPLTFAPINRAAVDESSTELPVSSDEFLSNSQKIDIQMPVAKRVEAKAMPTERPQFPSVPAKSASAISQVHLPAPSSPVMSSDTSSTPTEAPLSIQRATASTAPAALGEKDDTDSAADEIYEKVRTRLRKELRMYREQAGLHTYRGS